MAGISFPSHFIFFATTVGSYHGTTKVQTRKHMFSFTKQGFLILSPLSSQLRQLRSVLRVPADRLPRLHTYSPSPSPCVRYPATPMTRVLVLLLAASCLCSASSSRARTSGGDEAAFVPVWLDVVSNIVNAARYTDAAAKSTDQDLAMLPSLEALKTSAGTNACMNCTKAQMLENQITILSAVQSAFETVRQR